MREKTFANFAVLFRESFVSRKFSQQNLEAWHPFAWQMRAIRKSFLRENRIFHQSAKVFSLESFPLYGMLHSFAVKVMGYCLHCDTISFNLHVTFHLKKLHSGICLNVFWKALAACSI